MKFDRDQMVVAAPGDPHSLRDVIQLDVVAVRGLVGPDVSDDEVLEALQSCGLREDDIFEELDARLAPLASATPELAAEIIRHILFREFHSQLLTVISHRMPI